MSKKEQPQSKVTIHRKDGLTSTITPSNRKKYLEHQVMTIATQTQYWNTNPYTPMISQATQTASTKHKCTQTELIQAPLHPPTRSCFEDRTFQEVAGRTSRQSRSEASEGRGLDALDVFELFERASRFEEFEQLDEMLQRCAGFELEGRQPANSRYSSMDPSFPQYHPLHRERHDFECASPAGICNVPLSRDVRSLPESIVLQHLSRRQGRKQRNQTQMNQHLRDYAFEPAQVASCRSHRSPGAVQSRGLRRPAAMEHSRSSSEPSLHRRRPIQHHERPPSSSKPRRLKSRRKTEEVLDEKQVPRVTAIKVRAVTRAHR